MPKTNTEYWVRKSGRNVERHSRQIEELTGMGWKGLTLWECELADKTALAQRLVSFLGEAGGARPDR